jgi:hypothetical protein
MRLTTKQTKARGIKIKTPLESEEQKTVADYLKRRGWLWFHVPNGEGLTRSTGGNMFAKLAKMKAMGVLKGVSDCIILDTPPNFPTAKGAVLELKRKDGDSPTPDQLLFMARAEKAGMLAAWHKGHESAIAQLKEWGY